MKRVKSLARATALALAAISILGAGGASASELTSPGKYPITIQGGESTHYIGTNFGQLVCSATLSGEAKEASSSLIAMPNYSSCNAWGSAPLKTNGCTYQFHFGSEMPDGRFKGTFDIGPPGCGPMTRAVTLCTTSIGAQTGLDATYENLGAAPSGKVAINIDASGLVYSQTGSGCSKGTFSNGTYKGSWQVSGKDASGTTASLELQDSHAPQFEAIDYPVTIAGSQTVEQKFSFAPWNTGSCSSATFSGQLTGVSSQASVVPSFSKCTFFGLAGAVNANGCSFVYHASTYVGVGSYAGTMDLSCPAGKALEVEAGPGMCKISIPSQSGFSPVSLEDTLGESGYEVQVAASASGLTYTVTKDAFGCPLSGTGTFTNGSYAGGSKLQGLNGGGGQNGIYVWSS